MYKIEITEQAFACLQANNKSGLRAIKVPTGRIIEVDDEVVFHLNELSEKLDITQSAVIVLLGGQI